MDGNIVVVVLVVGVVISTKSFHSATDRRQSSCGLRYVPQVTLTVATWLPIDQRCMNS